MKHLMLDGYFSSQTQLDDLMGVYNLLNEICVSLNLKAIAPPSLVPYYYCDNESDAGISAYVLLSGGHITIHTFPFRECYFLDVLYDGFFNTDKLKAILQKRILAGKTDIREEERRFVTGASEGIPKGEFGPHVLIRGKFTERPKMEELYSFLDNLPDKIGMQAITRPHIAFDHRSNPAFLSGIILIAQSHIAFHCRLNENHAIPESSLQNDKSTLDVYFDIFSCARFNSTNIETIFKKLPALQLDSGSARVIVRGSKHDNLKMNREERLMRQRLWSENITSGRYMTKEV